MHSERCTSGSARGHAKPPIARSGRRACPTQPYIPMARGFVYLTAVVDVASRRVLAHRVAITLEAIHAKEVIEQALAKYGTPEIVNTDQGSQFTAEEFTSVVLAAGCRLSMDGRGAWRDKDYVSYCTSVARSGRRFEPRRRRSRLAPCALRGASSPSGSYRHSFLSL